MLSGPEPQPLPPAAQDFSLSALGDLTGAPHASCTSLPAFRESPSLASVVRKGLSWQAPQGPCGLQQVF